MNKRYIVRDIYVDYLNHIWTRTEDFDLEIYLNNEYGTYGFQICSTIPVYDEKKMLIAYKFIFVKESTEDD